ncbi:MAG: MBL fold metallo-hydrolase, partial [Planctomycetota bacterium]
MHSLLLTVSLSLVAALPRPLMSHEDGAVGLQRVVEDRQAGRALLESLREHLAPPRHRMEIELRSTLRPMTHGAAPGSVGEIPMNRSIRIFSVSAGADTSFRLDVERSNAVMLGPPGSLRINDGFALEDEFGPRRLLHSEADELRAQLLFRAATPHALVHYLAAVGRVLGHSEADDGRASVLVDCGVGHVCLHTVPVSWGDAKAPGLVGFEWVTHDRFLGDVVESLAYDLADPKAPGVVAGWTVEGPVGTGETTEVTSVTLDSKASPLRGGLFPLDPAKLPLTEAPRPPQIERRPLANGVVELLNARDQSRSLAVDLGPGWAVLEAPVSTRVGEALVRALETEKPGHPFLYVAASHHHPHYIGALRPFVHRGATIVCPAEVAPYVEHIVTRPWTREPDELARSGRRPRIIGVEQGERWTPPEAEGRWIAVESDGRSGHTEAFLVFFLPEERLAFGGDILWLRRDGQKMGPNP